MEEHKEELATIESIDSGAVYTLALKTHVGMSIETWRYFAGWCDKIQGSTIPVNNARPNRNLTFTKREPLGYGTFIIMQTKKSWELLNLVNVFLVFARWSHHGTTHLWCCRGKWPPVWLLAILWSISRPKSALWPPWSLPNCQPKLAFHRESSTSSRAKEVLSVRPWLSTRWFASWDSPALRRQAKS